MPVSAQTQEAVPVGVVAGQPRDLEAEHDPGVAHADLGDETLETFAVGGEAPDWPWSLSITTIRSAGQPSATARWRSAYWRWVDSVFSIT